MEKCKEKMGGKNFSTTKNIPADLVGTQDSIGLLKISPNKRGLCSPFLSWKHRARNVSKAHMENIASEAIGKRKPVLGGDNEGTDIVGKKGKKQQVGDTIGGNGENEKEWENNIEGSGMAKAGSQPCRLE